MGKHDLHIPYIPAEFQGYMDFFSEQHENKEPVILEDGTSVEFPAGWTDEGADKWRKGHELQRRNDYRASSYDFVSLFHGSDLLAPR
jgi:hypothetical protein